MLVSIAVPILVIQLLRLGLCLIEYMESVGIIEGNFCQGIEE